MGHIPLSPASSYDEMGPLEQYQDMASTSHLQPCVALGDIHQGFESDYLGCHGTLPVKSLSSYTSNPQALTPPVGYHKPDASADGAYGAEGGQAGYMGYTTYPPYTPEMSPQVIAAVEDAMHNRNRLRVSKRLRSVDSRRSKPSGVEKKQKLPKAAPKKEPSEAPQADSHEINEPLSIRMVSKGLEDFKDITAHANRPTQTRILEADADHKIKRPLNAFLLYRKHVIAFVKEEILSQGSTEDNPKKSNQQLVSRICGDSWRIETDNVKQIFRKLAAQDKESHAAAFPDYKYAPKPGKKADGDNNRKMESYDPGFSTSSPCIMAGHYDFGPRAGGAGMEATVQQGLYGEDTYPCPPNMQSLPSFYEPPYPGQYGMSALPVAGYGWGHGIPPVGNSTPSPHPQVEMPMSAHLRGIPSSSTDLYIDPSLLPGMGDATYAWLPREDGLRSHQGWQPHHKAADGMMAVMPDLDMNGAHNAYLRGGHSDWHVEPLDDTSHFNDWMAQEETART